MHQNGTTVLAPSNGVLDAPALPYVGNLGIRMTLEFVV
jgi:hypothetical protein